MNLKPHEYKLAAYLLNLASERFSTQVCNDLELVRDAGLTPEEAYEINKAYVAYNGDSDEYTEKELRAAYAVGGDDSMMAFMATRLEEMATEKEKDMGPSRFKPLMVEEQASELIHEAVYLYNNKTKLGIKEAVREISRIQILLVSAGVCTDSEFIDGLRARKKLKGDMTKPEFNLSERIRAYRRRYKRTLLDTIQILQGELDGLEDDVFTPSESVSLGAFHLIQDANRLKSLLEVEE